MRAGRNTVRRELNAEYMREWRSRNPRVREYNRLIAKARNRALVLLRERHEDEYRQLLEECKQFVGLDGARARRDDGGRWGE